MNPASFRHVYGPVPSKRLGRSLGVDLVPFKTCTYDCIYCQLGRTTCKTLERKAYVAVEEALAELDASLRGGSAPDYIGLAGSGEPTLNSRIGEIIDAIKTMTSIPVAVLTNGSLLWMPEVREALMRADLVLPSLDAGDPRGFRTINRPHEAIAFERMVEGLAEFTRDFPGEVWLEVFLLAGVNDWPSSVKNLATLVRRIGPAWVQLNTVSRPPAEPSALAPSLERMRALLSAFPGKVELISEEGQEALIVESLSGIEDGSILALLGRRPCTSEDVARGLGIHRMEALKALDRLTAVGQVKVTQVGGKTFYTLGSQEEAQRRQ
jgi:wyosine [tRNA(Phe)-imidazoG37] synthetase (radical SAM superfamily)